MPAAIFPGSFDPFTLGHADIVARALAIFDRIVIAIGINDSKRSLYSAEERLKQIAGLYADEPRVEVISYDGLTVDAARKAGARFIVRGVRSVADFEYERTLALVNRHLDGIETILLYSLPEHSHISSSIVRDLLHHGNRSAAQAMVPPALAL